MLLVTVVSAVALMSIAEAPPAAKSRNEGLKARPADTGCSRTVRPAGTGRLMDTVTESASPATSGAYAEMVKLPTSQSVPEKAGEQAQLNEATPSVHVAP